MSENTEPVPNGLRSWFVIHFVADILFAIPLLLFPQALLNLLSWQTYDPIMTRLVGAALMGTSERRSVQRGTGQERKR